MIYKFREGSRFAVKPQIVGEELERLAQNAGGRVTPPVIVEAARPADSPLHPAFEWDDQRAGELHREEQARQLIRSLVVVQTTGENETTSVISYVHVTHPDDGPFYATAASVVSDEELRALAIREALQLLIGVRRRFDHLNELHNIFAEIDRFVAEMERRRDATAKAKEKRGRKAQPRQQAV